MAFQDALHLWYGGTIPNTPSHCVCGHEFSVEHALSCPKGGFPSICHNEVGDITASLLSEVCHNIAVEPYLQPLSGEHMNLLTQKSMLSGYCLLMVFRVVGSKGVILMYGWVLNPFTQSNLQRSLAATYRRHELDKVHKYEQRVREIELSSFTHLIFSSSGGVGKVTTTFYQQIASMLAEKKN